MRAHTTLRSAFRFTMMMAAATGVTFAASQAHADTAGSNGGPNSSTGTAALKFDMAQGLDTSIDTGFLGPKVAQVRAVVKIDPVKDGGPLYSINMPKGAVVEASWAGDKKIVLKAANGSQTDGTVTVRHTLTPSLELKVTAFGLTAQFGFDATKLVNKIPGANFAYDSKATQPFAPWGFTKVDTKLNAPDLANSVLFSRRSRTSRDRDVSSTRPSGTATSASAPRRSRRSRTRPRRSCSPARTRRITTIAGESVLDVTDGDFMEVMAQVEGQMNVAGTMDIQPFVSTDARCSATTSAPPSTSTRTRRRTRLRPRRSRTRPRSSTSRSRTCTLRPRASTSAREGRRLGDEDRHASRTPARWPRR